MSTKKNTTRRTRFKKSDTAAPLNNDEIKRLAEKVAVALDRDTEGVQLLVLLLQHLWNVREDAAMFWCAMHSMESELFIGTVEADDARRNFRDDAYKQRATILQWPNERKVSA